jgi:glucose/mannose-6-phosphate isomerase
MVIEVEEGIIRLANALDTEGMIGLTRLFVHDIRIGRDSVNRELLPWLTDIDRGWTGVLFLGMGGSAAGGDFISALSDHDGSIPIRCNRGYDLPNWWTPDWLVVATSYSGNTEETLEACEQAMIQDGTIVVISSGGILSGMCELSESMYLISCPGGQPPRSAFGQIFSRQLSLMLELGILNCEITDIALQRLQDAVIDCDIISNPEGDVASLALNMLENPIAILGPDELSPVINRFKNQLNENSARFARTGLFPEMNHNESVAWGGVGDDQDPNSEIQALILISWDRMHPRVIQRMDWFVSNCPTELAWRIHGDGESLVECLLHVCIMTDWLTIALALLHGKNPSKIEPIHSLKEYLAQINQ